MKHKKFCHFNLRYIVLQLNIQLPEYFLRRPNPEGKFIDAFTVN